MVFKPTKILLDTSNAIKKLEDLKKKLDETAEKAEDLEGEGGGFLDNIGESAGALNPKLSGAASSITRFAGALGGIGLVAGAAAGGIALIAANLLDLPTLFRDSTAAADAFTAAVDEQLDVRNELSDIEDARVNARNRRQLRSLRLEGAGLSARQGELTQEKLVATERLKIFKDRIREEEKLLKDSLKRRSDAQKILDQEGPDAVEAIQTDPRLTAGRRIEALAARAQQEAQKGNLKEAQKFRDAAQDITDELGGHVFFQNQVDAATESITDKAKSQVAEEKNVQAGLEGNLKILQAQAEIRQKNLDILKAESAEITKQSGAIARRRAEAREVAFEDRQTQQADQAGRTFNAAAVKIRNEIERGGRTFVENFKDSLSLTFSKLTGAQVTEAGLTTERAAFQQFQKIAETIFDEDGATGQDFTNLSEEIRGLQATVGALQEAEAAGTLRGGQDRSLRQLERLLAAVRQGQRAAALFEGADRSPTQRIISGTTSPFNLLQKTSDNASEKVGTLGSAAGKATDNLNKLGDAGPQAQAVERAAGIPQASPTAAPAVAEPERVLQDITVNANIRGGIIDREVTEQIIDIVRRNFRRGSGNNIST